MKNVDKTRVKIIYYHISHILKSKCPRKYMSNSTNESLEITVKQFQKILKNESMKQRKRALMKKRLSSENAKDARLTSWDRETDG
jgi:hypothetical protein